MLCLLYVALALRGAPSTLARAPETFVKVLPMPRTDYEQSPLSQNRSILETAMAAQARRRPLLGRYSARDPDQFDFFGERREEQCQDDLDCQQPTTGRVCDRRPNDAAGYCRCPDDKPVKVKDSGRVKCVQMKVEEPRCVDTAQCTITNPYLQCVNQKCACVTPNIQHNTKGCIPGETQAGRTASWMAPLGFLFAILAIMTCTFFITRYRKEDDGIEEEQILSESPQGSGALGPPPPQRAHAKSAYGRIRQWLNKRSDPPRALQPWNDKEAPIGGPQYEEPSIPSTSRQQIYSAAITFIPEPEPMEGVFAISQAKAQAKPVQSTEPEDSRRLQRTAEDSDQRKSFLPLPFSMGEGSLRNITARASSTVRQTISKLSYRSSAEAAESAETGQRYRSTMCSPRSRSDQHGGIENTALMTEDDGLLPGPVSQEKVKMPLPVVPSDSAHHASSSSSNDIKLPTFSRMSRHYESEDGAPVRLRPEDVRAVPVHMKRLKRGLEMLRSERQNTGILQHLLDGRDLFEREEMSPLSSTSSSEGPPNPRPNSVSRNVQTDITVSAAIPVLPFASLNVLSPMPFTMKPADAQRPLSRRTQQATSPVPARKSSTEAGDAEGAISAESHLPGAPEGSHESILKHRIAGYEQPRQPAIPEELEISSHQRSNLAQLSPTDSRHGVTPQPVQVLHVAVARFPPETVQDIDIRHSEPRILQLQEESTGQTGGVEAFLSSATGGVADRTRAEQATLKARSCYSMKETMLGSMFPNLSRTENVTGLVASSEPITSRSLSSGSAGRHKDAPIKCKSPAEKASAPTAAPDTAIEESSCPNEANPDLSSHTSICRDKGYSAGEGSYRSFDVESQLEESKDDQPTKEDGPTAYAHAR